jgi:hypothetical protein
MVLNMISSVQAWWQDFSYSWLVLPHTETQAEVCSWHTVTDPLSFITCYWYHIQASRAGAIFASTQFVLMTFLRWCNDCNNSFNLFPNMWNFKNSQIIEKLCTHLLFKGLRLLTFIQSLVKYFCVTSLHTQILIWDETQSAQFANHICTWLSLGAVWVVDTIISSNKVSKVLFFGGTSFKFDCYVLSYLLKYWSIKVWHENLIKVQLECSTAESRT